MALMTNLRKNSSSPAFKYNRVDMNVESVGMGGLSGKRIGLGSGISTSLSSPISLEWSLCGTEVWSGAVATCKPVASYFLHEC